jgi:hypothetical protein
MSVEVQLARVEEQVKAQTSMMREFIDSQKIHNANFANTSLELERMKAKQRGAIGALLAVGGVVSAAVAWVVAAFKG